MTKHHDTQFFKKKNATFLWEYFYRPYFDEIQYAELPSSVLNANS